MKLYFFFQTFYRENIDSSKILRPQTTNAIGQNLFMPNFTTHDVIEEVDSQKSSVISHWDQLSGGHQELLINEEDPDEVFSEMRPAAASSEATTSEANVPKGIKNSETYQFPLYYCPPLFKKCRKAFLKLPWYYYISET